MYRKFLNPLREAKQKLTQGRNTEAGADAEALEKCYLLGCKHLHGLLTLPSYSTQDQHPRGVPIHNGLCPPTSNSY